MDDAKSKKLGGTDACIWLSYTTAFTSGGRTHTIEMGIPMPIGASEEQREQLLCEAEAGMGQLIGHVEQRISQMLQGTQPKPQTVEAPLPPPSPMPKPAVRSAAIPAPQTTTQPSPATDQIPQAPTVPLPASQAQTTAPSTRGPLKEQKPAAEEAPRRSDVGAMMPRASVPVSASTGNLSLPDFVRYVREQFGLDPKQAMQMLNVTTLSRGINLREALEQLRRMVAQKNAGSASSREPQGREQGQEDPPTSPPVSPPAPAASFSTATSEKGSKAITEQNTRGQLREVRPLVFDEEVEPDEESEADTLEDLDESYELTEQSRSAARSLINRLRERRGTTNVSEARLRVLNNVMGDDINEEQLLDLVQGVWGVNALKKLKVDQVEELISWAKTDNFTSEVEAVLTLLEEDVYARGSR